MDEKIIEKKLNEYSEYLNLLFDEPEKYSFSKYSNLLLFLKQAKKQAKNTNILQYLDYLIPLITNTDFHKRHIQNIRKMKLQKIIKHNDAKNQTRSV